MGVGGVGCNILNQSLSSTFHCSLFHCQIWLIRPLSMSAVSFASLYNRTSPCRYLQPLSLTFTTTLPLVSVYSPYHSPL